jgi:molecular chaperone Hsp33
MPGDHLIRAIATDVNVRVVCSVTTELVTEAARRHRLKSGPTLALGKGLTAGLLLATTTKGKERVTVQLVGDGPLGAVTIDANADGDVRGYVRHPDATSAQLGRDGVCNVTRDLGLRELYQGQVNLVTGEVDEDVEAYLRTSEQVPSALGCEVVLADGGIVRAAAGVLVQALPEGDTNAVREMQHALRTGRLRELLEDGLTSAAELAGALWTSGSLELLDERAARFACQCSRARISDMLRMLPPTDLDEMAAENHAAEIVCNYCNTAYVVERDELRAIRDEIAPRQSN